jgi:hypothetical protein
MIAESAIVLDRWCSADRLAQPQTAAFLSAAEARKPACAESIGQGLRRGDIGLID